jgi:radical SAM protein with 4Fe4S-binding SPASM domain
LIDQKTYGPFIKGPFSFLSDGPIAGLIPRWQLLTWRRLANACLLALSYGFSLLLRRPIVWGRPVSFSFEPTTACNLRCPECISGLRAFTRPTGKASLAVYEQTLDQMAPTAFSLTLYFQGEPLIHPGFFEMVRLAKSRGLFVMTSSNGHFFSWEKAKETVQSGLDQLIISVDGATQSSYAAYRKGGKLDLVVEGIGYLAEWKKRLNSRSPKIVIQVLAFRQNESELAELRRLGLSWGGDEVKIKSAQILDPGKDQFRIPRNTNWSRYQKTGQSGYQLKSPIHNRCKRLWFSTVFTWDARVLPCCFDKDAQQAMGTLEDEPFGTIWRGSRYQQFRQSVLKDRKQHDMCRNCSEGCRVWLST